jgi:glycosyltransferase involved in cell wall biosynthesis
MKIAFIWQGFDGRYGQWRDGLWAAMQLIEKRHQVRYFDFPLTDVNDFNPDIVLYWEACCTAAGKDRDNYETVRKLPFKKALLFAGGPIRKEWCTGFDLFFVESRLNEEEFSALGIPWKRAFGVNTQIFKPEKQPKVFDGVFQATCASWKRHWLGAEALGSKYAVMGRHQATDPMGFMRVRDAGGLVLPELSAEAVASVLNASHTVINSSDYWGGGQRATLEAMACGVMPVVMTDSTKNREFVEESGFGLVVDPDPNKIREAVQHRKEDYVGEPGVAYIRNKWTERHYADALLAGIKEICG